jgi:uncharacterized protein (DUF1330 family)
VTQILLVLSIGLAVAVFALFIIKQQSSRYALVDLVETKTPDELISFVRKTTDLAEGTGGHLVLAHNMLPPVVIPDQRAADADRATNLLVITECPTREAGEAALAARHNWAEQHVCRTYATQPAQAIELKFLRTIMSALELFSRVEVPKGNDKQQIESLIETSHIVQCAGIYTDNWTEQLKLGNNQPIWMLNFLEYAQEANYEPRAEHEPAEPISGARAYVEYAKKMGPSLAGVGGRIAWKSTALKPLPDTDDGQWHEISIASYPSIQALMTMYAQPAYRSAHVHRLAGLARTRLVATQPIQEHKQ